MGSASTLFVRHSVLAFAIVTQVTRDDFEQYFAGVSHESWHDHCHTQSDLSSCEGPRLLHEYTHCRGTSPPRHTPSMMSLNFPTVCNTPFVAKTFKSSAAKQSGLTAFRFANERMASTPHLHGASSSGLHGGHCINSSKMLGSRAGTLVLKLFVKSPHPFLSEESIITQQSTSFVVDELRVKRPVPAHISPLGA